MKSLRSQKKDLQQRVFELESNEKRLDKEISEIEDRLKNLEARLQEMPLYTFIVASQGVSRGTREAIQFINNIPPRYGRIFGAIGGGN